MENLMNCQTHSMPQRCEFGPGDIIDRVWRVEKEIGSGTFGIVYLVSNLNAPTSQTGPKLYALKLLKLWEVLGSERTALSRRFEREYRTGLINSPYLVRSISHGTERGNLYIVMEYCPGGDLASAVQKPNPGINLLTVLRNVLQGLSALHHNGKVHRDLKPENVLLRADGTAVLTDFGIAGDQNNRMTRRGLTGVPKERFGTIIYMPPEQVNPRRGNATVLPTTDVFSFGVMAYRLITGRLPFGPLRNEADIMAYTAAGAQGQWDRTPLQTPAVNPVWEKIIEGCLQPSLRKRLQNAGEILELMPNPGQRSIIPIAAALDSPLPQTPAGTLALRMLEGEQYGHIFPLAETILANRSIHIGRQNAEYHNHVAIQETESTFISRRQATLSLEPDGSLRLRDGQNRLLPPNKRPQYHASVNGTYIGASECSSRGQTIVAGQIITIGDAKLRLEGALNI